MSKTLDEILDEVNKIDPDWMWTDHHKDLAKEQLESLILEAKYGIVINSLNLLNNEPIHTVEQALLFDKERLEAELLAIRKDKDE